MCIVLFLVYRGHLETSTTLSYTLDETLRLTRTRTRPLLTSSPLVEGVGLNSRKGVRGTWLRLKSLEEEEEDSAGADSAAHRRPSEATSQQLPAAVSAEEAAINSSAVQVRTNADAGRLHSIQHHRYQPRGGIMNGSVRGHTLHMHSSGRVKKSLRGKTLESGPSSTSLKKSSLKMSKVDRYKELLADITRPDSWRPLDMLHGLHSSEGGHPQQVIDTIKKVYRTEHYSRADADKYIAAIKELIRGQQKTKVNGHVHHLSRDCVKKKSTCENINIKEVMNNGTFVDTRVTRPNSKGADQRLSSLIASNSEHIFVTVKTASALHLQRLPPLLATWLQTIDSQQVRNFGVMHAHTCCATGKLYMY